MVPRAAVQPISGGSAPGKAPTNVAIMLMRFSGVYTATYPTAVNSVSMPVIGFVVVARNADPSPIARKPTMRPCASEIRLAAMGRLAVRGIRASVRRSSTWFSVLDPAVTAAMPSIASANCALKGLMPDRSDAR